MPLERDGFGRRPALPPGPTGRKLVAKGREEPELSAATSRRSQTSIWYPGYRRSVVRGREAGEHLRRCFPALRLVGVNGARPAVREGRRWPVPMGILSSLGPYSCSSRRPMGAWVPRWVRVWRPSTVRAQGARRLAHCRATGQGSRGAVPPGRTEHWGGSGEERLPSSAPGRPPSINLGNDHLLLQRPFPPIPGSRSRAKLLPGQVRPGPSLSYSR